MISVYLNFFSVSALIPAFFNFFTAYFLLSIPKKSPATVRFGIAFLCFGIFQLAYFPASGYFHSVAAFHRWVTVFMVFFTGVFFCQFFMHFPKQTHPRFNIFMSGLMLACTAIMSSLFFLKTYDGQRVYNFSGHYWDFAAADISKITGLLIILFILSIVGLGIWRAITQPSVRVAAIGIALAWVAYIVPAATNVLSRDGALGREIHQTIANLLWISGNFTMFIVFVNTTRDRTTFMAKIVGVTLATFLLLITGISYLTLNRMEAAYDQIHAREAALAVSGRYRPADLKYILVFDPADAKIRNQFPAAAMDFRGEDWRTEFLNADVRRRVAESTTRPELDLVLSESHPAFAGYHNALRAYLAHVPADVARPGQVALARLDADRRTILYRTNKIRALPDQGFRGQLTDFLAKNNEGAFGPFAGILTAHLNESETEDAALKAEALEFLRPVRGPTVRGYRRSSDADENAEPAVTYFVFGPEGRVLYEVGFSYLAYRAYIHEASLDFIWILAGVLIVVLFGFRVFFRGSLLSPLEQLLQGLRQVNDGDLRVKVPVRVEDEIGYVSRSFNRMVASIRLAQRKLQDYANNLEDKVKERTAELKESLDQVQTLKTQQDGDYFLTSLLISPLASNKANGDEVNVDFLLKQKKQFRFRNWDSEIGGDICAAHRIELRDHPYTVFLNADAMGKSIQGAGGALVVGSVFESIVSRTKLSSQAANTYPERWLKNAFIELHKIFESFEGSMLVSIVVGLLDETSGLMYYINAEHPFTVLYRDGRARFLERDFMLHKLGFMGLDRSFHITTFQLEPGDVVIAGSDGRDDIALGVRENGDRIINEDETKFLMVVEEADGDLSRIQELLQSQGELTDDLSLLQIKFNGSRRLAAALSPGLEVVVSDAREARRKSDPSTAIEILSQAGEHQNGHPKLLAEWAMSHYAAKDYQASLDPLMRYIEIEPGHTSMIYRASLINKVLRRYEPAADLGERVRLREPDNVANLVNLANVYINMGNQSRARDILEEALNLDPRNAGGLKLREHMERK